MKCSEAWLREWVNPNLSREELCEKLTMTGLEVDELAPVASPFSHVVVGEVLTVEPHPQADRLKLCEVNVGNKNPLHIVCGADNVRPGIKVPTAIAGAILPNGMTIKETKLRGELSQGMLCSSVEIGLAEESKGLLILPDDAPVGEDLRQYLQLDDYIIDVSITPNRGDCLSIKGLAREIAASTQTQLTSVTISDVKPAISDTFNVNALATDACPVYVGRIIRDVKADTPSPMWLKERLRRSGNRSISIIVDIVNYVMLELGQPMHAFDLDTLQDHISVRYSKQGEKITLLDGSEKITDDKTLVIADQQKLLAIAGVMGGLSSSVTLTTKNIFLESAFFQAKTIARQRQYYLLNSDSSYRYERGIDPTIQRQAIERATQLIIELAGGKAGPVAEKMNTQYLPKPILIELPINQIKKILGIDIPTEKIEAIFSALKFDWKKTTNAYQIQPPLYRHDLTLPEDIIEELARLYGYNHIPTHALEGRLGIQQVISSSIESDLLRDRLSQQGFHEVISYSFIDQKIQSWFDPDKKPKTLLNPITAEMSVMRTNLWPGLVNTMLYNQSRQQSRIRIFELGMCFTDVHGKLEQRRKLAGLVSGEVFPEQWGVPSREADFFDLKGQIETFLMAFLKKDALLFKPETNTALHPGQSAGIYIGEQRIGYLGKLHPTLIQKLDAKKDVFLFEIDPDLIIIDKFAQINEISKFPEIRRDFSFLINEAIPSKAIQDTIKVIAGDWLKDVFIFDVYQGKGVSPGLKSIALALILQHPTRTLVDEEVAKLMEQVVNTLKLQLGAELRS